MRKSQSSPGFRRAAAGFAAATLIAAALVGLPTPAYAANVTGVVAPLIGLPAGTITVTGTAMLTGISAPIGAEFTTATCPLVYTAAGTGIVPATTVVKTSDTVATITVPTTLTAGSYKVCVYAGATTGVSASAIAGNGASYTVMPLGTTAPTSGVAVGGNTIVVSSSGTFTSATALGATFTANTTCPAAYSTAVGYTAASATKTGSGASTTASIAVPTGLTAPATYTVCVYAGIGTSALLAYTTYTVNAPLVTLSAVTGPNAGGNSVTVTAASALFPLATVATPGVTFSVAACPTTYTATPANLAPTVTRVSDTQLSFTVPAGVLAPSIYNICIYSNTVDTTSPLIGTGSATYSVTLPLVTLSPAAGPTAGGNTITAASTTVTYLAGVAAPGATFSSGACPGLYATSSTNIAGTTVRRLSTSKVAVTVPAGVIGTAPTAWTLCIYSGALVTSTLVAAPATYTVATALGTLSISPGGGPAQGGSLVTVTASGLPATADLITAASIGGSDLTDIVISAGGLAFTAHTSPHAAANNLTLSVTTAAGTKTLPNIFSYSNGIQITPNTAPNTGTGAIVDVDVLGVGFTGLNFVVTSGAASTSLNPTAHVFLVQGAYNSDDLATGTHVAARSVPPVAECTSVVVISDTELICTLTLTSSLSPLGVAIGGAVPIGTYTLTTVSNAGVDVGVALPSEIVDANFAQSIISSAATFTVAPY